MEERRSDGALPLELPQRERPRDDDRPHSPLFALPAPVQLVSDPYDPYAEQGVPGKLRKPW
jgi:hypothetical protein